MRSFFSNPEALQAMMQIQQGMQRLQTAAPPEVLSNLGFMGMPNAAAPRATTTPASTPQQPASRAPPMTGSQSANYFSQMLNMMGNNTLVSGFFFDVRDFLGHASKTETKN